MTWCFKSTWTPTFPVMHSRNAPAWLSTIPAGATPGTKLEEGVSSWSCGFENGRARKPRRWCRDQHGYSSSSPLKQWRSASLWNFEFGTKFPGPPHHRMDDRAPNVRNWLVRHSMLNFCHLFSPMTRSSFLGSASFHVDLWTCNWCESTLFSFFVSLSREPWAELDSNAVIRFARWETTFFRLVRLGTVKNEYM